MRGAGKTGGFRAVERRVSVGGSLFGVFGVLGGFSPSDKQENRIGFGGADGGGGGHLPGAIGSKGSLESFGPGAAEEPIVFQIVFEGIDLRDEMPDAIRETGAESLDDLLVHFAGVGLESGSGAASEETDDEISGIVEKLVGMPSGPAGREREFQRRFASQYGCCQPD